MKTYNCFIKMINNKSIIYNKSYLTNTKYAEKIQNYIHIKNIPLIINISKYNKISYIEFEKFNKFK